MLQSLTPNLQPRRNMDTNKPKDAAEALDVRTGSASFWMPIETAPRNGEHRIMIAAIHNGEIQDIDFDAVFEQEQESWELPQAYWLWKSAYGRIEEPTHWAFLPSLANTPACHGAPDPK